MQKMDCCGQNVSVAVVRGHTAVDLVIASAVAGQGVAIAEVAVSHVTDGVVVKHRMDKCLSSRKWRMLLASMVHKPMTTTTTMSMPALIQPTTEHILSTTYC